MMKHINDIIGEGMHRFLVNKKAQRDAEEGHPMCEFTGPGGVLKLPIIDYDLLEDKKRGDAGVQISVQNNGDADIEKLIDRITDCKAVIYSPEGDKVCSLKVEFGFQLSSEHGRSEILLTGSDKKTFYES